MTTKTIPIFLPGDKVAWVMAGPTHELPDDRKLIRCAAEIDTPKKRVAFDVATKDFSTFDSEKVYAVLPGMMAALARGDLLYVGCMGGTGRTGTLLAILAGQHPAMGGVEAITYIRSIYKASAIETPMQENQVFEFSERKFTEKSAMINALEAQGYYVDPAAEREVGWFRYWFGLKMLALAAWLGRIKDRRQG